MIVKWGDWEGCSVSQTVMRKVSTSPLGQAGALLWGNQAAPLGVVGWPSAGVNCKGRLWSLAWNFTHCIWWQNSGTRKFVVLMRTCSRPAMYSALGREIRPGVGCWMGRRQMDIRKHKENVCWRRCKDRRLWLIYWDLRGWAERWWVRRDPEWGCGRGLLMQSRSEDH